MKMLALLLLCSTLHAYDETDWSLWKEYTFECDQPGIGCGKTHLEREWDDAGLRKTLQEETFKTIAMTADMQSALVSYFGVEGNKNKYVVYKNPALNFAYFYYGPTTNFEQQIDIQSEGWMQRDNQNGNWTVLFTYPRNYENPEEINQLLDKYGIERSWANFVANKRYSYKQVRDLFHKYEVEHPGLRDFRVYYCEQFTKTGECQSIKVMMLKNVEYSCFNGDSKPAFVTMTLSELDDSNGISVSVSGFSRSNIAYKEHVLGYGYKK